MQFVLYFIRCKLCEISNNHSTIMSSRQGYVLMEWTGK